ncbi:MAG: cytidylyltransferase domain-containing protein [Chitinophagales bacterium]
MSKGNKIGAIIQTRMGSTRLPGKVMLNLCGKPVIHHVIDRVLQSKYIEQVIIATTVDERDRIIVDAVRGYHSRATTFRGSEEDVLDRYYQAAVENALETVVRITSDCPLIDPGVSDLVVSRYLEGNFDYVSNTIERTYPRGLDTEAFSFQSLEKAWKEANRPEEREHVTPYIWRYPEKFRLGSVVSEVDFSGHRWTLDTVEDWEFIQAVYNYLYQGSNDFLLPEVLALLNTRPELTGINANVEQKPV